MANKFETKRYEIEELGNIYDYLERRYNDHGTEWKETEELRQSTKWDRDAGKYVPIWEDEAETIPVMEHVWKDVPVADEELSDEHRAKRNIIKKVMEMIDKMV